LAEKKMMVAFFDFVLGLIELGAAYAVYEVYDALNASYLSSSTLGTTALTQQVVSNFILLILIVGVFVAIHGIKRIIENVVAFWRAAVASSKTIAANLPQPAT
jgi:TRAP-type mannitol/chloroaromatic compound transport system permease small subunit